MTVRFEISMSLDGYVRAPNPTPEEPLGQEGERLHDWGFGSDPVGSEVAAKSGEGVGAAICGRRTYDDSLPFWGADGPSGSARTPLFVVSHDTPNEMPEGGVYHFVTGGIEAALEQAKAAAGGQGVTVMGGADIGQQFIRAGLVDEISIHLVPITFGGGLRLFENLGEELRTFEVVEVVSGPKATHLRYRHADAWRRGGRSMGRLSADSRTRLTDENCTPDQST
jgi:dihydrofolate reductase